MELTNTTENVIAQRVESPSGLWHRIVLQGGQTVKVGQDGLPVWAFNAFGQTPIGTAAIASGAIAVSGGAKMPKKRAAKKAGPRADDDAAKDAANVDG